MRLNLVATATALLLLLDNASASRCAKGYKNNHCLRSIVDDVSKDQARLDCAKNLRVTVTPRASTTTTTIVLPTTSVSTTVITTFTTVDQTTTESTQTNLISDTKTVEIDTTTTTTTEYAVKTVDAVPPQVRDVGNGARNPDPAMEKTVPAYASACDSFEKYASACKCLGVCAKTTAAPTPTVTATSTEYTTVVETTVVVLHSTDISYTPVTETVEETTYLATETTWKHTATSTTTEYTATITSVVRNGGFESGEFAPWQESDDNQIDFSIGTPGNDNTKYDLETGNMIDNDLLEIYQDTLAVAGVTYTCVYDWKFTDYYETYYPSTGKTYIPYVHVYIGNSNRYIDWVSPDDQTKGIWQTSTFQFTAVGGDRLWFDCASPQPEDTADGGGPNKLYLDNIACYEA